nr:unnamed protein product [Digitaria exilis]
MAHAHAPAPGHLPLAVPTSSADGQQTLRSAWHPTTPHSAPPPTVGAQRHLHHGGGRRVGRPPHRSTPQSPVVQLPRPRQSKEQPRQGHT